MTTQQRASVSLETPDGLMYVTRVTIDGNDLVVLLDSLFTEARTFPLSEARALVIFMEEQGDVATLHPLVLNLTGVVS